MVSVGRYLSSTPGNIEFVSVSPFPVVVLTIPSHSCGMGCGRGWSQPHSPHRGHHFDCPQKGICDEESGGCSDDADEDTG